MTKYILGCVIWTVVGLAVAMMFLLGLIFIAAFFALLRSDLFTKSLEKSGYLRAQQIENMQQYKWWILGFGIGFLLLGAFLLCWVLSRYREIKQSAGVLDVASNFLFRHPQLFLIMLFCFLMQLISIGLILYAMLVIYTSGTPNQPANGFPYVSYNMTMWKLIQIGLLLFGLYWICSFWNNLCDFTVASVAVDDYYRVNPRGVFKSFCNAIMNHLGSIALGSLILTPIDLIKTIYGPFHAIIADDNENIFQKILRCLCCCIIIPYEKFCMMVDDNAFAMVYMTKLNFCPAARKDFYLNRRVGRKVGHNGWIAFFYSIFARIAIAGLTTWLAYFLFTTTDMFRGSVRNPVVPTIVS